MWLNPGSNFLGRCNDLEIDSENRLIKFQVTCLLTQDIRKEILLSIANQLMITKYSRVLIDLTDSSFNPNEPMVGAMALTKFMETIGIQPHVKIAFVYSEAETHRKYFERVAGLEGFNLRYFKNRNKAFKWLE